ncbi:hypothetical protein SBRCBS47491_004027 [Sporothrix bragantina]|uniref:Steroid 5-alpha reductase C-terminal domain-containing protein n=1 Tax=Sporothrix bragantina TaxID=671064 RepID=A0ABP0BKH5_9PEZI
MPIHVLDKYYLGITALITVAYQLLFFAVAFTFKFDKLTDFAGGTNFVVLAVITIVLGTHDLETAVPRRQIVVTVFLSLWALRLAGFLLFRILRTGTDTRFDDKRNKFFPFLGFWVAQMVWVWTVSLPVTVLNSSSVISRAYINAHHFGTGRDIAGIILFGIGFLCEAIADAQRFRFREKSQKSDRLAFCHKGLFAWSRHPNYFGEILLQFGIFTIASSDTMYAGNNNARPPYAGAVYASIVGPILLTLLLFFVSGMSLSERPAAAKRYAAGGDTWDAYRAYLHRTSILIPLPPALYAPLPVWLKRTLLLEFPLYVFDPAKHEVPQRVQGEEEDGQGNDGNNSRESPSPSGSPDSQNLKGTASPITVTSSVPPKTADQNDRGPEGDNAEPASHRKQPHSSAPRRHDSF